VRAAAQATQKNKRGPASCKGRAELAREATILSRSYPHLGAAYAMKRGALSAAEVNAQKYRRSPRGDQGREPLRPAHNCCDARRSAV
jgi:hypothetical protein